MNALNAVAGSTATSTSDETETWSSAASVPTTSRVRRTDSWRTGSVFTVRAACRGGPGAVAAIPLLWMPIHFFVSMRRVYGGSRSRTAVKFVALSLVYGTVLFCAVLATALVSLVTLA